MAAPAQSPVPIRRVEEAIVERVADRADEWFPGVGARPPVRLHALRVRPRAALYRVELGAGPGQRRLLAKVRRSWPEAAQDPGARPRLVSHLLPASDQTALEFAGLTALSALFGDGHPAFGAVRPLDHLPDANAILMEYVDAPTLRDVLLRSSRFWPHLRRGTDVGPESAWRRSGAWLRAFQHGMSRDGLPVRQATRDDVVDRFEAFGAFLSRTLGRRAAEEAVVAGPRLAADVLPERLPLAVGHGDFAPRNVFRLDDGRLAVFDPLCRWSVPRVEDLCRFLVALRLQASQVHSHGMAFGAADLERREAALLEGYRGEEGLPLAELRCYQLLVTLDKWSALVGSPARTLPGRLRAVSLGWASGFFQAETRRLVALTEAAA